MEPRFGEVPPFSHDSVTLYGPRYATIPLDGWELAAPGRIEPV
jgi:hypothetical protein